MTSTGRGDNRGYPGESGWLRVCASSEIEIGEVRGFVVGGACLAVWRDGEGGAHVWDDRCPHRGLPLSEGFVTGGLLTCPAHGWRFDINGQQIRLITSNTPASRDAVCATIHEAEERDGDVWIRAASR